MRRAVVRWGVVPWFVCGATALLTSVGQTRAAECAIRAGVAVADITPPIGYRMSGYFSERPSTGTHDPLQAKAIVWRQGDEQAALVVCDLCEVYAAVTEPARTRVQQKTGIPASHILIAATHSHTGPLYFNALREHFHNKAVAKGGSDPCEMVCRKTVPITSPPAKPSPKAVMKPFAVAWNRAEAKCSSPPPCGC